ncbi:MAG: hypothetical protein HN742_27855 [Lentisphaerae bacterium]|nr:hypothetical protein [Lentisphaerota bacterium]MBT4815208.1 hypothetical protein [Lentisphaerota bacterium]MBT5609174.1 hypothetical protein [Lentisphaerota bacterium]MBT7053622.1 hypothetical protein [Lentisphaerota bacterium]MBT7845719.1 hypothetical protein [Lentisphaerota bacterium]
MKHAGLTLRTLVTLGAMLTAGRRVGSQEARSPIQGKEAAVKLSLSELAENVRPGFLLGAHVAHTMQRDWDKLPQCRETLAEEFNVLSVGIYQKSMQRTSRDGWSFGNVDRTVAFARKQGMQVYAHPLFGSNGYVPDWLLKGDFTDEQLLDVVEERIKTVLTRYRGQFDIIDVYNEGLDRRTGKWRPEKDNFLNRLGMRETEHGSFPIILEKMFIWSRKYGGDDLKLIYNDNNNTHFGMGQTKGSIALFKAFRKAGIPIDGLGIQTHTGINAKGEHRLSGRAQGPLFNADLFARSLKAMGEAGAEVYVTECDVHLYSEADSVTLLKQAEAYRAILKACIEEPACKMFKIWGFNDAHCWKPAKDKTNEPRPLIFDAGNRPKPAYHTMRQLLLDMLEQK